MNFNLLAVLPLVALMAAPAFAGALGTTITEPEVEDVVVIPPPAGLGFGALAAGAAAIVVLGVLLNAETTTAPATP